MQPVKNISNFEPCWLSVLDFRLPNNMHPNNSLFFRRPLWAFIGRFAVFQVTHVPTSCAVRLPCFRLHRVVLQLQHGNMVCPLWNRSRRCDRKFKCPDIKIIKAYFRLKPFIILKFWTFCILLHLHADRLCCVIQHGNSKREWPVAKQKYHGKVWVCEISSPSD